MAQIMSRHDRTTVDSGTHAGIQVPVGGFFMIDNYLTRVWRYLCVVFFLCDSRAAAASILTL